MEESAPGALPGLPTRLVKVFFAPGELFSALRERPAWVGATLVVSALVGLSLVLIPAELWVEFSRSQMMERGQEIPPGFESSGGAAMRIFSVVGGVLGTAIMIFVMAGVVTAFFSFVLGAEGGYKHYLSVVAHASIITAVGSLIMVPLRISQGDPSLSLSLGSFAFFLEEGYLFRVLKMLELFALWSYGVMAIGVTKIDPRQSLGLALAFFFGLAVAFALVFGSFGG
jgi:hypothetical protein